MTDKANIPSEVTVAIQKATNVERGHAAHHKALIALVCMLAKMPDTDEALDVLTMYTLDRAEKSPDSLCTKATIKWLERHFGVHVTDKGTAKRGRTWEGKGFTLATREAAERMPWFDLAKELAFKVPGELSMTSVAAMAVRRNHAGAPMPTDEEVVQMFRSACADARKSAKTVEWFATFDAKLAAGEAERLDVEAPVTH